MTAPVLWPSDGSNDVGTFDVICSFLPNDASTPAASSFRGGCIDSIVYVSAGKWTITLTCADLIRQVLWADCQVVGISALTSPAETQVYFDETAAAGPTFTVALYDPAGSAYVPTNAQRVMLKLVCKNRGIDYNYSGT